jgi:hypothetical protein
LSEKSALQPLPQCKKSTNYIVGAERIYCNLSIKNIAI